MGTNIRNKVLLELENNFTTDQLKMIDMAIAKAMIGCKIEEEETLPNLQTSSIPIEIKEFLARKQLKGLSNGTIDLYSRLLTDFAFWLRKDINQVTDIDILAFLDYYQTSRKVGKSTLDNKRLVLSSFYTFMHDTGKMNYNPSKTIDRIKFKEKVREPLNDIELELVRNACLTPREKALFEVLYSTGGRVSEIIGIDYNKIDRLDRAVLITGKGDVERYVFFNAKAMVAIDDYLKTRTDDNPALFVGYPSPHRRLSKASIESEISTIGKRSGIGRKIFPHLLRHTFATDMLQHGAKINEVSKLLGHKKLATTQIYGKINVDMLKSSHKMYIA